MTHNSPAKSNVGKPDHHIVQGTHQEGEPKAKCTSLRGSQEASHEQHPSKRQTHRGTGGQQVPHPDRARRPNAKRTWHPPPNKGHGRHLRRQSPARPSSLISAVVLGGYQPHAPSTTAHSACGGSSRAPWPEPLHQGQAYMGTGDDELPIPPQATPSRSQKRTTVQELGALRPRIPKNPNIGPPHYGRAETPFDTRPKRPAATTPPAN